MQRITTILTIALAIACGGHARAGGGGYFTTYNSDVERGEVELMLMNDFTLPSDFRRTGEGQKNYGSHMLELEYGWNDHFVTELMLEWFEDADQTQFTGVRLEARYRLFARAVLGNPMLYVEYEDLDPATRYKMEVSGWVRPPYEGGEPDGRERILESRLVLSDHLGPIEIAFNWINETDLRSGTTAFGYALGAAWMHHGGHSGCACSIEMKGCGCPHCAGAAACSCAHGGGFGLGAEMFGGLGDTRSFGLSPSRQEHYFAPFGMLHLTARWMLHGEVAIGLTESSDQLARLNVGYEF